MADIRPQRARTAYDRDRDTAYRMRHNPGKFRLVCPARCTLPTTVGAPEAARLVSGHLTICPDPGPAVQPTPGGPVLHPLVYADRISR